MPEVGDKELGSQVQCHPGFRPPAVESWAVECVRWESWCGGGHAQESMKDSEPCPWHLALHYQYQGK